MLFSVKNSISVSDFQLKRLNLWRFLYRNLDASGEIINKTKFKTK